jgi:hypothetical protein
MIVILDAGSRPAVGTIMVEAWKHGIEVEHLHDYQVELTTAHDTKMENLIKKFPYAKILHTELVKEVQEWQ